MSITIGSRVRAVADLDDDIPAGSTGVVVDMDHSPLPYYVHFDMDEHYWCAVDDVEEYTPVFASHYQAQPIMDDGQYDHNLDKPWAGDEPVPATDDAGPTPDEIMNITRSFCR